MESLNAISYHLDEQLKKKCKKKTKKSQTDWVWLNLHRRREKYKTIEAEHSYGLVTKLTECKLIRHERLLLLKREYVPFQKHTYEFNALGRQTMTDCKTHQLSCFVDIQFAFYLGQVVCDSLIADA